MTTLLVAGLTGSGKTSATKLVAQRLTYQWISGSDLRRQFFGLDNADVDISRLRHAISESNLRLESARLRHTSGEGDFDAELLYLAKSLDNAVFDVWFLPWLIGDYPMVTALLRASLQTRAERIARMTGVDATRARNLVSEKDERAREYALKQYGIDISCDHSAFNTVFDTDDLTASEVAGQLSDLVERAQGTGRE